MIVCNPKMVYGLPYTLADPILPVERSYANRNIMDYFQFKDGLLVVMIVYFPCDPWRHQNLCRYGLWKISRRELYSTAFILYQIEHQRDAQSRQNLSLLEDVKLLPRRISISHSRHKCHSTSFFGPMTYSKKAVLYERNVYIYSFTSNGISIMGLFNEIYRVSTVNIHEIIQVWDNFNAF